MSGKTASSQTQTLDPIRRRVLVVGDDHCGKASAFSSTVYRILPEIGRQTSLLVRLTTGSLPKVRHRTLPRCKRVKKLTEAMQNIPPVLDEDVLSVDVHVRDRALELALRDTGSGEEYDRLRPLSYADVNVIVLCFAVDEPETLHELETKV